MNTQLYGLLAESPIHAGSGQSTGFVDLPCQREAATDYPVIPGSSVKGALRDFARTYYAQLMDNETDNNGTNAGKRDSGSHDDNGASIANRGPGAAHMDRIFGKQDSAGQLVVADARILLLPVRSMSAQYRWLTCSHVIERVCRDLQRAELRQKSLTIPIIDNDSYLGADCGNIYLEERQFSHGGALPEDLCDLLGAFFPHDATRDRLPKQLTVLSDHDFAWFARHGLAITARNVLNDVTKTSENLWYEESLPPDTLLYALMAERGGGALASVREMFAQYPYLQVGGNETVGHGWCAVHPVDNAK